MTNKKKLARFIQNAMERCWKEFCAPLDRDLWGWPYKTIMSRMARRSRTKGLHMAIGSLTGRREIIR